jgi:hypothetical protein
MIRSYLYLSVSLSKTFCRYRPSPMESWQMIHIHNDRGRKECLCFESLFRFVIQKNPDPVGESDESYHCFFIHNMASLLIRYHYMKRQTYFEPTLAFTHFRNKEKCLSLFCIPQRQEKETLSVPGVLHGPSDMAS